MNTWKLNALAASAMGYKELHLPKDGGRNPFVMYSRPGMDNIVTGDWNPSTCADDALVLLAKTCPDGWDCETMPHHPDERLRCVVTASLAKARGLSPSVPLAMTLCALRAAGIPESEITAAME